MGKVQIDGKVPIMKRMKKATCLTNSNLIPFPCVNYKLDALKFAKNTLTLEIYETACSRIRLKNKIISFSSTRISKKKARKAVQFTRLATASESNVLWVPDFGETT